jgi:diguanylate cyclase (GGDEF)-like protein
MRGDSSGLARERGRRSGVPTVIAPVGGKSTILVVEDEVGIARMIQVLLEARGFATVVCHSGDEALRRIAERPVDLVLLDVMMPGMDGYEVCRRLKADQQWRHIPVVMLTAKDTTRDMVVGLEIGADDYITKPFNTDELIARIKVLLRIRGMSLELMGRNRELQALNAVALAVNRSLGLEEILDGALAGIMDSLGLAAGLVHLVEPGQGHLLLRAWRGLGAAPQDALRSLAPGSGWIWAVLEREEPLLLPDAAQMEGLGISQGGPPQPAAIIPLRFQDQRLGVLTVLGQPGQNFSGEEAGVMPSIGRQVSIALENSRLYTETRRKAQEFEALYQVSRTMASTLDLQNILTRISETVSSLLQAQAMSLMLLGPDGRSLSTVAGYNLFDEVFPATGEGHHGVSPSLVSVREKRLVAVPDVRADPVYGAWLRLAGDRGFTSFLAIPLIVQDRALGCMNLYMIERHEFGAGEIQLLSTFASQAAVSIENARLFEEARQLAITDPLTGLANHRQFYDQLAREFRRAHRYQRPLTLLMLDLDHFKAFNDRYGHLAGDQALRETADILRQNARSVDLLARYGGEEFAIILPETDLDRAAAHAERIRSAVASHVFEGQETGQEHRVTISIGVAALTAATQKIENLVHDADQAMYRAKAGGRNRLALAPDGNEEPPLA